MERWTCPSCARDFGKPNQPHMCNPGLSIDEYFATAQPWERPIFDVVAGHLQSLGDVIIDPLQMGVLFKNGPMAVSLRAMKKWTALGFNLRRRLESGRLSRKVVDHNGKFWHIINIDDAAEIGDEILEWLTEAYLVAGGASGTMPKAAGVSMVPDDIDLDDEII